MTVVAVMGSTGRPNLTPVWFDYVGDTVLLNLSTERKKVEWLRANPQVSFLLVNPANPYHWMSIEAMSLHPRTANRKHPPTSPYTQSTDRGC